MYSSKGTLSTLTQAMLLLLLCMYAAAQPSPTANAKPTCTFTSAASAIAGKKSCSNIVLSNIKVPAGTTLDMTDLNQGTIVTFAGTTTFGYKQWLGPLISFSGTSLTVTGTPDHLINGGGPAWWDGQGSNGGKTKPKFFYAHSVHNSLFHGLNVKNTPVQAFSINTATNSTFAHININDLDGDTMGGHNTDGFDVGSSTGIRITNAVVLNQDDCMAINSGSDITFSEGFCSGGHGLSIGSVGGRSDNTVNNIVVSSSVIMNSENGVRVKTVSGTTGMVNNVTYHSISLRNITEYGIVIEQDYENGDPTGIPTAGVPITNLTLSQVQGTVSSGATEIYVLCAEGACSDWTWKNVEVTGGQRSAKCTNVPSTAHC